MVYLLEDGRQFSDKQFIQEGEQFIEIPNFIEPREEDGFIVYVSGIENGKPKYTKEEIKVKKPQPTQLDRIEGLLAQNVTDIENNAIDRYNLELVKEGVL